MKKLLVLVFISLLALVVYAPRAEATTYTCKMAVYANSPMDLNWVKIRIKYNQDPLAPHYPLDVVGSGSGTVCAMYPHWDNLVDSDSLDKVTGEISDNPVVVAGGGEVGHCYIYSSSNSDVIMTESAQEAVVLAAKDENNDLLDASELAQVAVFFYAITECE